MKVIDWIKDKLGWSNANGRSSEQSGTGSQRKDIDRWRCPNCGKLGNGAAERLCPRCGTRKSEPQPQQFTLPGWTTTAVVLGLTAGFVALGGVGTVGGLIATGVRVVGSVVTGSSGAAQAAGTVGVLIAAGTIGAGSATAQTPSAMQPSVGTSDSMANSSTIAANAGTWKRTGPFISSNGQEGRPPGLLVLSGNSITYSTQRDGKSWTNTLTWEELPPETLVAGQQVRLKMSATTEQGPGSIGGWWNANCYEANSWQGDNSAGSDKNYRLTGGPHNVAEVTFNFNPYVNDSPYIQLSAGYTPAADTWVLITYKYVPER
jgi:hypothetical protein